MSETGRVTSTVSDGIGTITFFHPKKNSLPGALLKEITAAVTDIGENPAVRVMVLRSEGDGPFCAGASFDELLSIQTFAQGKEFFMGFARLILAMKKCPKFIIARIQGKAVGGGVGVTAAADYALATERSAVKLSELALGIGPFVVGPAVERKLGSGPFSAMSIDADWRDAAWAKQHGLYVDIYPDIPALDAAVAAMAAKLAGCSPEAMALLKAACWKGSEDWDQLLESRAEMSGKLVLSAFTAKAIAAFKQQ